MSDHEQEEKGYPLVYNMWIEGGVEIHANTVILQTGKPTDPPPPALDETVGEG